MEAKKVEALLALARDQLGIKENPPDSNRVLPLGDTPSYAPPSWAAWFRWASSLPRASVTGPSQPCSLSPFRRRGCPSRPGPPPAPP